jgi:WD repeat-containing protein 26
MGAPTPSSTSSHFKREEYIRLILQSLFELGYNDSAKLLEKESGFQFETKGIGELRESILEGKWDDAERIAKEIKLILPVEERNALYLLRKHKYVELLELKDTKQALSVLRKDITTLGIDAQELHELSR